MDTKANADQLGLTENISCEKIHKLNNKSAVTETEEMVYLSSSPPPPLDNGGFVLSPITPDSKKENSDIMSSCSDDYPSTPKEGVFDPFAPGPENLMMAPFSMKHLEESRNLVARKLNFNRFMTKDVCEERFCESFEDDKLLEAIYESLLEVIICNQAEDMVGEISAVDSSPDEVQTPPSAPRLTGIAVTCPGAPLKSVKKSRNVDLSLCRKLEYDF